MNPTQATPATRAEISAAITADFTSIGYCGPSKEAIAPTPWFHDKATAPDGKLREQIFRSWAKPFGHFYAVAPQVMPGDARLRLSPSSDAFTGFTDNGREDGRPNIIGDRNGGYVFYSRSANPDAALHFPALGFRKIFGGGTSEVKTTGYYWSSAPIGNSQAGRPGLSRSKVEPKAGSVLSSGVPIRPVRE